MVVRQASRGWRSCRRWLKHWDKEIVCRTATAWIDAFGTHRGHRLVEENARLLRGFIWCCAGIEDTTLASSLANAAIEGYRKITGVGPRSAKIAVACLFSENDAGPPWSRTA